MATVSHPGRRLVLAALATSAAMLGALPLAARQVGAHGGTQERVLFVSSRDGKRFNVGTVSADGSLTTRLTHGDAVEYDPAWSPDRRRVVFAATADARQRKADVYVMDADGTRRTALTRLNEVAFAPAWSPDGRRIAFSTLAFNGALPGKATIWVMDADGRNPEKLREGMMPNWSPDGRRLLYTSAPDEEGKAPPQLFVMDADGKNPKLLSTGTAMHGVWSPDGKRIAYEGVEGEKIDLFVMNSDGTQPVRLTRGGDQCVTPQWSSDGRRLFFGRWPRQAADAEPLKMHLWVMDADGSNARQVTRGDRVYSVGSGLALFLYALQQG